MKEISLQTGMASFIVARMDERGYIKTENVGTQPFGDCWHERRMTTIRTAFSIFDMEPAIDEIEYNAQRSGGIVRARRIIS